MSKRIGWLANVIGERGEKLFEIAITDYRQFDRPLFRTAFLGDKWPSLDFVVELIGVKNSTPIFYVQVKSTAKDIENETLEITLDSKKAKLFANIPGPTYLIGVHEPTKRVFIRAVNDGRQGVYRIPTSHELTPANLQILHDEVKAFWLLQNRKPKYSAFE